MVLTMKSFVLSAALAMTVLASTQSRESGNNSPGSSSNGSSTTKALSHDTQGTFTRIVSPLQNFRVDYSFHSVIDVTPGPGRVEIYTSLQGRILDYIPSKNEIAIWKTPNKTGFPNKTDELLYRGSLTKPSSELNEDENPTTGIWSATTGLRTIAQGSTNRYYNKGYNCLDWPLVQQVEFYQGENANATPHPLPKLACYIPYRDPKHRKRRSTGTFPEIVVPGNFMDGALAGTYQYHKKHGQIEVYKNASSKAQIDYKPDLDVFFIYGSETGAKIYRGKFHDEESDDVSNHRYLNRTTTVLTSDQEELIQPEYRASGYRRRRRLLSRLLREIERIENQ